MAGVAEPESSDDAVELISGFLDYYRGAVVAKLDGLSDEELRRTRLRSGWTPLGLLKHLVFMERRWLRWGLLAEDVDEPWGDGRGRWTLSEDDTLASLTRALATQGERTRAILATTDLTAHAPVGGRFRTEDEAPTGWWICLHVLQEYARHAGHLDIVCELADGRTGQS